MLPRYGLSRSGNVPASELETLKAKLAKREGMPGYEDNVQKIKARIAELERSR